MLQEQVNVRISPKLKRQLTVLQKSLYQTQKIKQDRGERSQVKMLTLPEVIRIVLTNAFNKPGSRIRKADDLTTEEEVEAEMLSKVGIDFWNNEKLLEKDLLKNQELEELDQVLECLSSLQEKKALGTLSPGEQKEFERLDKLADKLHKKHQQEMALVEKWSREGRYQGRRRRPKKGGFDNDNKEGT